MDKREKVIKGLECCCGGGQDYGICEECPYTTNKKTCYLPVLHRDALELLKVQEPRVMTLEEVKNLPDETDVWIEEFCTIVTAATISHNKWLDTAVHEGLIEPCEDKTFFYGISADYSDGDFYNSDYGKQWRCWTSRATAEQIAATPWEAVTS